MLAVPTLDGIEEIDRFFYLSWAGLIGVMIAFFFHLLRDIDYYTLRITPVLVLLLQLAAALGCLYLYFNARMGTGIFATT